ncbi:MAG: M67 family metallopeptidase [Solirubrobacterales bacterium]|nr:M67 family metallopeptidase [Solirubrobacterales bacterium]
MRIAKDLLDEIVAHSRDDLPNECCGLIGGREGEAASVHRARNAAATWLRYELHPTDQLRIMNRIEDAGEDLVGIYHSHTKSEAYPSQTDINLADAWPDPLYLICSLEHADSPVVRAFAIRDGAVEEADLDVG